MSENWYDGGAHVRIIHGEWRDERRGRRFAQGCSCGWVSFTSDGWNALAEYYDHRDHRANPGCCSGCGGTGGTTEPDTGGKCWDCQGTGHPHDGPCGASLCAGCSEPNRCGSECPDA